LLFYLGWPWTLLLFLISVNSVVASLLPLLIVVTDVFLFFFPGLSS
jgi:hypothetical protein